MAWCFRCVSGVLSVLRCMVPGLIASVLDTWRTHCAVPAPEQGCPRSEAGRGTRRRVRIVVNEGALRQRGAGADPRTGASSSGTKPALKAAAPLTARTPAPGLRCEAPRGGATNRASHPRLLKTVNISPQNRHNLRKHKRAHEQASSSCAEIDSVPPRSVDLDRAMRSLPERPVRR